MSLNLSGKRVLVTGAGAGIGRGLVKTLAEQGAEVYGVSKTKANLESLKAECPSVTCVELDLCDWNMTKTVLEPLPTMDAVVNNAAIAICTPFLDVNPEDFDKLFNANVKQVINVSQIFSKKMIQDKIGGSIVNVSSQASQAALTDHTVYCATKGALDMVTKVAALELGPHKIRVNAVNPTVTMTAMGKVGWSDPAKAGPMLAKIPLGRFAEVEDVVNCILFLLSDNSSMVNGITLPIDGGFLAT